MFRKLSKFAKISQVFARNIKFNPQKASYVKYVPYNWQDPLNFESLLKDEEIQIRDMVLRIFFDIEC